MAIFNGYVSLPEGIPTDLQYSSQFFSIVTGVISNF